MMILMILVPVLAAAVLPFLGEDRKKIHLVAGAALVLEALLALYMLTVPAAEAVLFSMTETLTVALRMDGVSKVFMAIAAFGFLPTGIYAFKYLEHEEGEGRFFVFFLLSEAALMGMDFSRNLITMYFFFEMITLLSMPLVLHDRSKESVRAAMKYLFYSVAGAFLALGCIFFLNRYATTLEFNAGGNLDAAKLAGHETLLLVAAFLGVIGFGAKAGLYPLHGWLPTAHPVAPAPASAVLSGIIAKAGVLAVIRLVFFSFGTGFLFGTWVHKAWLALALLTVFMGSMMAYREKVFKKRLAYSSVSQISYVMTGLLFLTPESVTGGLLHVLFHACIKVCLFLVAGSFIHNTGKHNVDEYRGYGKSMPVTLWAFTIASLALIGIPPASGFVSKWYLAMGALNSGMGVFTWLAPVVLLVSALLTAGYLLPVTINGFFPGEGFKAPARNDEGGKTMWLPVVLLSAGTLVMGIVSQPIVGWLASVAASMF
ncbi:MAG: proton-conducting transporter membrane subunit [Clostridia bacterium]|nr:proton-conducting transporter membrane subunit [Clostridia bacterium]